MGFGDWLGKYAGGINQGLQTGQQFTRNILDLRDRRKLQRHTMDMQMKDFDRLLASDAQQALQSRRDHDLDVDKYDLNRDIYSEGVRQWNEDAPGREATNRLRDAQAGYYGRMPATGSGGASRDPELRADRLNALNEYVNNVWIGKRARAIQEYGAVRDDEGNVVSYQTDDKTAWNQAVNEANVHLQSGDDPSDLLARINMYVNPYEGLIHTVNPEEFFGAIGSTIGSPETIPEGLDHILGSGGVGGVHAGMRNPFAAPSESGQGLYDEDGRLSSDQIQGLVDAIVETPGSGAGAEAPPTGPGPSIAIPDRPDDIPGLEGPEIVPSQPIMPSMGPTPAPSPIPPPTYVPGRPGAIPEPASPTFSSGAPAMGVSPMPRPPVPPNPISTSGMPSWGYSPTPPVPPPTEVPGRPGSVPEPTVPAFSSGATTEIPSPMPRPPVPPNPVSASDMPGWGYSPRSASGASVGPTSPKSLLAAQFDSLLQGTKKASDWEIDPDEEEKYRRQQQQQAPGPTPDAGSSPASGGYRAPAPAEEFTPMGPSPITLFDAQADSIKKGTKKLPDWMEPGDQDMLTPGEISSVLKRKAPSPPPTTRQSPPQDTAKTQEANPLSFFQRLMRGQKRKLAEGMGVKLGEKKQGTPVEDDNRTLKERAESVGLSEEYVRQTAESLGLNPEALVRMEEQGISEFDLPDDMNPLDGKWSRKTLDIGPDTPPGPKSRMDRSKDWYGAAWEGFAPTDYGKRMLKDVDKMASDIAAERDLTPQQFEEMKKDIDFLKEKENEGDLRNDYKIWLENWVPKSGEVGKDKMAPQRSGPTNKGGDVPVVGPQPLRIGGTGSRVRTPQSEGLTREPPPIQKLSFQGEEFSVDNHIQFQRFALNLKNKIINENLSKEEERQIKKEFKFLYENAQDSGEMFTEAELVKWVDDWKSK